MVAARVCMTVSCSVCATWSLTWDRACLCASCGSPELVRPVRSAGSTSRSVAGVMGVATATSLGSGRRPREPSQPERSLDRGPEPNEVAVATPMTPATERLVLPADRTGRTSSGEPQDAHRQALSQVKDHVAQTLHETVMQTLAATIYLAESPDTSRQDLVEYIRQATHELRCVIDDLAVPEPAVERLSG